MERGISRERIERVARMYKRNQDACRALSITLQSFSRLCRKYDVETPSARHLRALRQCCSRAVTA